MPLAFIDNLLNRITMYRLVLYVLTAWIVIAALLGAIGKIPFSPSAIVSSTLFLVAVCWSVNTVLGRMFRAPVNVESAYITAFILALIITPVSSLAGFQFLFWAGLLAMASKYLVQWQKKHLFNPAAFAVVVTFFLFGQAAGWWVAAPWLLPFVLMGGFLIVRKIQRFDLVISFFLASLVMMLLLGYRQGTNLLVLLQQYALVLPTFFFAFVMLTEPLTTPPTKKTQMIYGALVGVLFAPQWHVGMYYSVPEFALIIGNLFSYIVSPKGKFLLTLKEKIQQAPTVLDFVWQSDKKFAFQPGQYLEWTVPHRWPDLRGNRRYFTIASSPTESTVRLGSKFYEQPSTFKKALQRMKVGNAVLAGQLSGEFTLPTDQSQKLVFIAGGIGITPFRSMIKYLLDTNQKRIITLFYSNKTASDIVYKDIFDEAVNRLGINVVYTLSDPAVPAGWTGKQGNVTAEMIQQEVPDYKERLFYISGPHGMVTAFEKTLKDMGVPFSHIKIDFFPGFV